VIENIKNAPKRNTMGHIETKKSSSEQSWWFSAKASEKIVELQV